MIITMTIDEVIEHCKRTVEFESKYIMKGRRGGGKVEYSKRYLEHKLVAEWLEELKELREFKATIYQKGMDYSYATFMYNKAIDDLTEKIVGYGTYDYYGNVVDVLEIAEKLKEHKTLNIVHCKDCKHWGTGVAGETENVKCCEYSRYMVGMNGYCVYGEKECVE